MFSLFEADSALETCLTLGKPYVAAEMATDDSVADIRRALTAYLDAAQPHVWHSRAADLELVREPKVVAALADIFRPDEAGPDGSVQDLVNAEPPAWKLRLFEEAYAKLSDFDEMLGVVTRVAVNAVFTTTRLNMPGNMTTGRAVGLIWIDPRPSWDIEDVIEAFVHETTHTLLMLDEHRFGHYTSYPAMRERANLAQSAIRNEPRPLNAVIHSLIVACEILAARDSWLSHDGSHQLHQSSPQLRQRAESCLQSVLAVPAYRDLTTPRVQHIVARAREYLSQRAIAETGRTPALA